MLHWRQLQNHLAKTNFHVNAFYQGLVSGTGLASNYPPLLKFISDYVFKALILFVPNVNSVQIQVSDLQTLHLLINTKTQKVNTLKAKKKLNLLKIHTVWHSKKTFGTQV
ncbi:MAG: hypothetical protein M3Z26_00695 [Bacteroidota bacterium]|nr:hypothetical protein [Bacteroidota bacterium]